MLIAQESDVLAFNRLFSGRSDRKYINVRNEYKFANWARSLGATKEQVRLSVAAVGDDPDKVDAYLKRRWATRGWKNRAHLRIAYKFLRGTFHRSLWQRRSSLRPGPASLTPKRKTS
jgi:hypothetical protein